MAKWNTKINLTSLPVELWTDDAIDRLIVEPTIAARNIKLDDEVLMDLGSGGGSPAIPLALAAPWIRLVMVESRARKAAFLREVCRQLGMPGASVANSRFEDLAASGVAHSPADLVSVRAVRADGILWRVARKLLKTGGRVLWFTTVESRGQKIDGYELIKGENLMSRGTSYLAVLQKTH
jgi:16S rRNA (guanine527-N7)-methyltransferase